MEHTEEKVIEVYHFDMRHAVNEGKTLYFLSPSIQEVKDLAQKGLYEKVADVFSDDLDVAFEKTNHIDKSWQENKEVYSLKNKARSTSVGDLFIRENEVFLVSAVGFEKMPNELRDLLINENKQDKKHKIK